MENKDRSPSPPPQIMDKRVASLKRRSSMGQSVRKSRSIIGMPFEDQISAIPKTTSVEERLLQIVSASWTTAARAVQVEYDNQDVHEDNPQADLVDHLRNSFAGRPILMNNQTLMDCKESIQKMSKECKDGKKPQRIIPPRLKKLNDILEKVTAETEDMKNLLHSRKTKYQTAKMEKRQIISGEKIITNKQREQLPVSEDAWLRGLSDGHDEWKKVQEQEKLLLIAQKNLAFQLRQKRKHVTALETEINVMANKIQKHSERVLIGNEDEQNRLLSPPKSADFTLS